MLPSQICYQSSPFDLKIKCIRFHAYEILSLPIYLAIMSPMCIVLLFWLNNRRSVEWWHSLFLHGIACQDCKVGLLPIGTCSVGSSMPVVHMHRQGYQQFRLTQGKPYKYLSMSWASTDVRGGLGELHPTIHPVHPPSIRQKNYFLAKSGGFQVNVLIHPTTSTPLLCWKCYHKLMWVSQNLSLSCSKNVAFWFGTVSWLEFC